MNQERRTRPASPTANQDRHPRAPLTDEQRRRAAQLRKRKLLEQRRKRVMRNRLIAAAACVVLIVIIIIVLVSCSNKRKQPVTPAPPIGSQVQEPTPVKPAIKNEKPIRLYTMNYGDMTCYHTTSVSKPWSEYEDLESFGAFYSTADSFPFTNETQAHNDTWKSLTTETTYKIGYELSFDVNGEHKVCTIRKPEDIKNNPDLYMGDYPGSGDYSGITGYIGCWIYDDLNQDDNWYIHLEPADMNENTLITSIKIRPTPQSDAVSNLVLRAYSYSSEEEFDENGVYIGDYAASVTINRE